jgi:hypothetical protein
MKKSLFVLSLAVLLAWHGCTSSNSTDPQSNPTGIMQVLMTDDPAAYDQVNIVVDSVRVHVNNADTTSGWYTLNNSSTSYNLLNLVNGVNAMIGNAKLPAGHYTQLRLYIGSGSNVVVNGQTKSLNVPSGSQSGLKLNVDATIHSDVVYVLLLDFDAGRSIVVSGPPANPAYSLKPVIRVVTTATTGTLAGTVTPAASQPSLWAYGATDTLSTGVDPAGVYKFIGVLPGTYSLFAMPKDPSTYRDTTITNINVNAGGTTTLNMTLSRR